MADAPDLYDVLGHFSDALALAETAQSALECAQEDGSPIGGAVLTLDRGLHELRRAWSELDRALTQAARA